MYTHMQNQTGTQHKTQIYYMNISYITHILEKYVLLIPYVLHMVLKLPVIQAYYKVKVFTALITDNITHNIRRNQL